ncbi:META domain-containing protein [Lysobacter antibioticus]|uniref:META domain-containing protein n=1 Tax=Lysobacter antibioticus TaxID=84531 RepID=UPI00034A0377|nr:META domain-containing protein [Lysobacter antibioticus]
MHRLILALSLAGAMTTAAAAEAAGKPPVATQPAAAQSVTAKPDTRLAERLQSVDWRPVWARDARGRPVAALNLKLARDLRARFRNGTYELVGVCNTVSGAYRVEGGRLLPDRRLDTVETTAGCLRDMAAERAFFAQPLLDTRISIDWDWKRRVWTLHAVADDGSRMELVEATALKTAPGR